ncbi:hypothetical protein CERSUDRAFT_110314 [Gelatoporia subvermispora B]|uniref:AB hydrolase-1 domain-containing protein n=1 Tax=Ceriporiopsis subvermispora (strain B) TaxID=914234 RepID=M2RTG4_CERS8|nr:hypothetical protein CERSUDRAFT_110314 [Gelatoporia subvermispora B]
MAAVLTRSLDSRAGSSANPPQPHRAPTKKSSFLSLKRQKQPRSPVESLFGHPSSARRSPPHDVDSYSTNFHAFDDAIAPHISRTMKAEGKSRVQAPASTHSHARRGSDWRDITHEDSHFYAHGGTHHLDQGTYLFPSVEDHYAASSEDDASIAPRSRPRFHTGPSHPAIWDHSVSSSRYPVRDSTSSFLSHFESQPQTPIDDLSSLRGAVYSIPMPVVVAPTAGVEAMDALVDGMNHDRHHFNTNDDHFMGTGGIAGRNKVFKSGHHPLYHPPLPTPPPGVVLGGGNPRRGRISSRSSDEDDDSFGDPTMRPRKPQSSRPESTRVASSKTAKGSTTASSPSSHTSFDDVRHPQNSQASMKTVPPSISEIIRAHAPPSQQVRSRKNSLAQVSQTTHHTSEFDSHIAEDESDLVSRSSVDTIAEEVQQTIRNQRRSTISPHPTLNHSRSFQHATGASEKPRSISSPRSEGRRESSIFSYSTVSDQPPLPPLETFAGLTKVPTTSPSQKIAQYLRSARLTTILKLTRSPHASRGNPLTVSLSDLGSPTGWPLIVFLGLGCVRHVMGLYDEMAECLGIRLITVDRWGLGRTDVPRSKMAKGIPEWASVVEEVLDRLQIDQCSVMAHSAGAPYALAFANKYPERIRGDICLLAPWVGGGEGAGYKWLKYVPTGILRTAQAAEWKVQAWMLGKPPTLAFEGIGFDASTSRSHDSKSEPQTQTEYPVDTPMTAVPAHAFSKAEAESRQSSSSGVFSDYDDLRDFDGRFESRSTLGRQSTGSQNQRSRTISESKPLGAKSAYRKPSNGFLGRLRGTYTQSPGEDKGIGFGAGKKLKALRSMGSLKGKSKSRSPKSSSQPSSSHWPRTPQCGDDTLNTLDSPGQKSSISVISGSYEGSASSSTTLDRSDSLPGGSRNGGRRTVSVGASKSPDPSCTSLPSPPPMDSGPDPLNYQATLGNALIAASHAESSRGTHGDLLQILNHERLPWGFSYAAYPHDVRVWYGDRDERIAENAVRWLESTMGRDKCHVSVVKGADHALMYKSSVVVDVLEHLCQYWQ